MIYFQTVKYSTRLYYHMSAKSDYLGEEYEVLLDEAASEEHIYESASKRNHIEKIGKCLLYAGYSKADLGVEIGDRIEARFFEKYGYSVSVKTSYYYRIMRELKWGKNFAETEPQNVEKSSHTETPREKLDSEEKPIPNSPRGVPDSSQQDKTQYTPKAEYGLENKRLIDTLGDVCGMADVLRDYMRHNPFMSKMDPDLMNEIILRLTAWVVNMRDTMNNKQIVLTHGQHIILQKFNTSSDINNLFGLYLDEIKRIHILERAKTKKTNQILTSKEIMKYQRRDLKNMNDILEFHDANEARMSGYYGQQCNQCKGFRTVLAEGNNNKVVCVKCMGMDETNGMKREIFYTCMQCRFLVENPSKGKCEHCGFEYVYPANL